MSDDPRTISKPLKRVRAYHWRPERDLGGEPDPVFWRRGGEMVGRVGDSLCVFAGAGVEPLGFLGFAEVVGVEDEGATPGEIDDREVAGLGAGGGDVSGGIGVAGFGDDEVGGGFEGPPVDRGEELGEVGHVLAAGVVHGFAPGLAYAQTGVV